MRTVSLLAYLFAPMDGSEQKGLRRVLQALFPIGFGVLTYIATGSLLKSVVVAVVIGAIFVAFGLVISMLQDWLNGRAERGHKRINVGEILGGIVLVVIGGIALVGKLTGH